MASFEIDPLVQALRRKRDEALKMQAQVRVGYSADYASFIHEDLEMWHAPPTQAKFLEAPLRTFRKDMGEFIRRSIQGGMTVKQALYLAGTLLLGESQALCPVRTGYLRSSGYVTVEDS